MPLSQLHKRVLRVKDPRMEKIMEGEKAAQMPKAHQERGRRPSPRVVSISVPEDVFEDLKLMARSNLYSFSGLVRSMIIKEVIWWRMSREGKYWMDRYAALFGDMKREQRRIEEYYWDVILGETPRLVYEEGGEEEGDVV